MIQLINREFGNHSHTEDDLLSGLTAALALVTEAVAFAIIGGVQPLVGLYAAFIDGHIYLHGRDKKLHCIDLTKGEAKWSTYEDFGEYWSMIQKGDRCSLSTKKEYWSSLKRFQKPSSHSTDARSPLKIPHWPTTVWTVTASSSARSRVSPSGSGNDTIAVWLRLSALLWTPARRAFASLPPAP